MLRFECMNTLVINTLSTLVLFSLSSLVCFQEPVKPPFATAARSETLSDSLLLLRFQPPAGYQRPVADTGSFGFYLRHLPLRPPGSKVRLFDGREKPNDGVYAAVVDLPIGDKDLHQCADAVIRLRAEYLWQNAQFDRIHFNLTNGFRMDYRRWRQGERLKVSGNKTDWVPGARPSDSRATFWAYLETVFSYAGTLSLAKELKPVAVSDIRVGDVFILGGSPGHAVLVVDLALDTTGKKIMLLAQSYMPAQEIQILQNPSDPSLSPWYPADFCEVLVTPEWNFGKEQLKRFDDE